MAKGPKRPRKQPHSSDSTDKPSRSNPKRDKKQPVVVVLNEAQKHNIVVAASSTSRPKRAKKAKAKDLVPVIEDVAVSTDIDEDEDVMFVGEPVPDHEARAMWPHRYDFKGPVKIIPKTNTEDAKEIYQATRHFRKAAVEGVIFELNDHAYLQSPKGVPNFIARIVELFETVKKELYFSAQWVFRAEDTVIKSQAHLIDRRRVFYSDMKDDNPLNSIVSKVKIVHLRPNAVEAEKKRVLSSADYYYDMQYSKPVTFTALHKEPLISESESLVSKDTSPVETSIHIP